ncbi:MAG: patatin [Alphaproteobacteria bacterium]|nr:MAG: patatin [Alphaproteobacteria bacterium]
MGNSNARIGLALGGGAALGWAHIGVLRALEDARVPIDAVAGTSIGAVVAACVAEDKLDHLEDIARSITAGTVLRYLDLSFARGGVLGGRPIVRELKRHFGTLRIEELAKPFAAVAADLVTGEEVWIREGSVVDAVRASIALPGVFTPMRLGARMLADGGLICPVPVAATRALGASHVIAVNLQGDYKGRAKSMGLKASGPLPRRATFHIARAGMGLMLRSLAQARLRLEPADVLINPQIGHVEVVDFRRADELIALGRQAAQAALPEILTILKSTETPAG